MRRVISILCLTLVYLMGNTSGQEVRRREKRRAVVFPSDVILTVIAHQPDCPLKFTKAMTVRLLDGDGGEVYQLSNRGSKPIRAYTVAVWNSTGGGNVVERTGVKTGELLMPGQTSPLDSEGEEIELVRLTEELRDKLKLRGPMKAMIVFMVVRVEFADGTTYSDESTSKALQAYFERVGARVIVN